MLEINAQAPAFFLRRPDGSPWQLTGGKPSLLFFFETDCPTCRLTIPYLNKLAKKLGEPLLTVIGISQDGPRPTRELVEQMEVAFTVVIDSDLGVSRQYDPPTVPALFLLDRKGKVLQSRIRRGSRYKPRGHVAPP
jgi:peroxiredoxin